MISSLYRNACRPSHGSFCSRRSDGSFIAEAPLAIWALLFMFTLPFVDMAATTLRYTFVVAAARDGVHEAARSKTFAVDASATDLCAGNAARLAVTRTASAFSEITVTRVDTRILETNITTKRVNIYATRLLVPADTSANLYEIETTVTGTINPLVTVNSYFPRIPGLTAAVPISVTAREYCEYPQGLNQ